MIGLALLGACFLSFIWIVLMRFLAGNLFTPLVSLPGELSPDSLVQMIHWLYPQLWWWSLRLIPKEIPKEISWISFGDMRELLLASHAVNDLLTIRLPSSHSYLIIHLTLMGMDWRSYVKTHFWHCLFIVFFLVNQKKNQFAH